MDSMRFAFPFGSHSMRNGSETRMPLEFWISLRSFLQNGRKRGVLLRCTRTMGTSLRPKNRPQCTEATWAMPLSYYADNWTWFGIALYNRQLPNLAAELPATAFSK